MTPDASAITTSHAMPRLPVSSPCTSSRPAPRPTEVILALRPVAAPLTRRPPTSILMLGGKLTVAAVPRTHPDGSVHTITVWMAHCMGADVSSGAATGAVTSTTARVAGHIKPVLMTTGVAGTERRTY